MSSEEKKYDVHKMYKEVMEEQFKTEEIPLGPWTSYSVVTDPKHLCFVLSRYKFCAKMLAGYDAVMEVGGGDCFGLPLVAQAAKKVHVVDWDPRLIEGNRRRLKHLRNVQYHLCDFNKETLGFKVAAIFTVDVLEHIDPENEDAFSKNMIQCLHPDGVMVTGTPNITSSQYATPQSELLHVNLKSMKTLREWTSRYFKNVFMFGMNDEVLHTGYAPMCHYLWSLGVGLKDEWVQG